jgi:phthalate 4,5-dioxygenase reductase component
MLPDASEQAPMRIAARREIASAIHSFELRSPVGGELPPFTAGAHIPVRTPSGAWRKYSLCNDPSERDRYLIAVKRERDGRGGSASMADAAMAGDEIHIGQPRNDFALQGNPARYIFIAGGIGITPIRSMMLHLEATGGKPYKLYYLARTPEAMAFREELSGSQFHGKCMLHTDDGDPARVFDLWPVLEAPKGAHVYCCGPRGLMEQVRDMTGHWSKAAVHFEDFGTARSSGVADAAFTIRLARSGVALDVPAGKSILEVLRANGREIASSCESGSCGTCRTRLLAGDVDHRDWVLSEAERAAEIMVCVSRARSGELTLDL